MKFSEVLSGDWSRKIFPGAVKWAVIPTLQSPAGRVHAWEIQGISSIYAPFKPRRERRDVECWCPSLSSAVPAAEPSSAALVDSAIVCSQ